jgi:hypothetical protein
MWMGRSVLRHRRRLRREVRIYLGESDGCAVQRGSKYQHTKLLQLSACAVDLLCRFSQGEGCVIVGTQERLDYAFQEAASRVCGMEDSHFGYGHREGAVVVDLELSVVPPACEARARTHDVGITLHLLRPLGLQPRLEVLVLLLLLLRIELPSQLVEDLSGRAGQLVFASCIWRSTGVLTSSSPGEAIAASVAVQLLGARSGVGSREESEAEGHVHQPIASLPARWTLPASGLHHRRLQKVSPPQPFPFLHAPRPSPLSL